LKAELPAAPAPIIDDDDVVKDCQNKIDVEGGKVAWLKDYMAQNDLKQSQIADSLSCSQPHVSNFLKGKTGECMNVRVAAFREHVKDTGQTEERVPAQVKIDAGAAAAAAAQQQDAAAAQQERENAAAEAGEEVKKTKEDFLLADMTRLNLNRKILGKGSFGNVHSGYFSSEVVGKFDARDITSVAVKSVAKDESETSDCFEERIERELDALILTTDIPGVASLLCYSMSTDRTCVKIVTPLIEGRNLDKVLHDSTVTNMLNGLTGPANLRRWAFEIARGLESLHAQDLAHFDIKPANVVLSSHMFDSAAAIIIDFGCARLFKKTTDGTVSTLGTNGYMAPEVSVSGGNGTKAADVFSYGVVLWEMFQAFESTRGRPRPRNVTDVIKGQLVLKLKTKVLQNEGIRRLVDQCLLIDDELRVSAEGCVAAWTKMGGYEEERMRNIGLIDNYARNRVEESRTEYIVGRKVRCLKEWRRVTKAVEEASKLLSRLTDTQLQMIASGINDSNFICNDVFNKLDDMRGSGLDGSKLDHKMQKGIYLWRNKDDGKGYVGKIERTKQNRGTRDTEHRTSEVSKFDQQLKRDATCDSWECVSVVETKDAGDCVLMEVLLALVLDTYVGHNGFNDELGGVWGATKRFLNGQN
jgi:serine/threonine protein kinase/predicted XRE-type DNA-binding protein